MCYRKSFGNEFEKKSSSRLYKSQAKKGRKSKTCSKAEAGDPKEIKLSLLEEKTWKRLSGKQKKKLNK